MSKAKKIAIISDTSGNLSGTNLSGTNTGDQVIPVASSTAPAALGVAAVGTGTTFARADHIHLLPTLATLGAQAAGSYLTVGGALGTPASGTLTNCTFPTLNQSTTGTASNITAYTINQSVGTANAVQHSDITTARTSAPTTGYLYYGNTATKYAGFDGTSFVSSMPMSFNITGSSASATNATNLNGTAGICGYSTASATISYAGAGGPQVMGTTTNAAMLSFHRAGAYAVNFGLDTDNVLKVGGWSIGGSAYPVYHQGNQQPSVSGSSGSCTGNAATATTATNQSGGTVSATTGAFSGSLTTNSHLRVGNGLGASDIYMADSDEGERRIHCNSNNIGFLNQANGWGSYCVDDGSWVSAGTISGTNITTGGNVTGSSASCTGNAATATTFTSTTQNSQFNSIGVGTAAAATAGDIRATANITAYYTSDERLKENISPITNALEKVNQINGVNFDWTEEEITARGGIDGYFVRKNDVGVIAQEIEQVLPEAVATRDNGYKAVRYELIVPLLIEAIKDLSKEIDILKGNK